MKRRQIATFGAQHLFLGFAFADWARDLPPGELNAVAIQKRFNVSRAQSYRYLAAWNAYVSQPPARAPRTGKRALQAWKPTADQALAGVRLVPCIGARAFDAWMLAAPGGVQ